MIRRVNHIRGRKKLFIFARQKIKVEMHQTQHSGRGAEKDCIERDSGIYGTFRRLSDDYGRTL